MLVPRVYLGVSRLLILDQRVNLCWLGLWCRENWSHKLRSEDREVVLVLKKVDLAGKYNIMH